MKTKIEKHIETARLIKVQDPEMENAVHRRPGFEAMVDLREIDKRLGEALSNARKKRGLTRSELAPLLGLTTQVYGRYERGEAQMHVSRLVHLSELLDFAPLDLIYAAAPHLWGSSQEEAELRFRLTKHVEQLSLEKATLLMNLIRSFLELEQQ